MADRSRCRLVQRCPSDIVLDGDPAPPPQKMAQQPPTFWPMSVVAKWSPISATAELLLHSSWQSVVGHIGATWGIRFILCSLATPGEYDWTCASLGPPESTTQTANRSGKPFSYNSRQCTVGHIGAIWRIRLNLCTLVPLANTIELMLLSVHPSAQPKRQIDHFSRFCTDDRRVSLYCTMGHPFPSSKLPLAMGDFDPRLIHGSLSPHKSSTQMSCRLVQPFLQGSLVWQTNRPTDHATRSVTIVINNT